MATVQMRTEVTVDVDLDLLARVFAELDDHSQSQFFVKVAALLDAMPPTKWTSDVARWQAEHIGRHLATCACSTDSGRIFVGNIYEAMIEAMRCESSSGDGGGKRGC